VDTYSLTLAAAIVFCCLAAASLALGRWLKKIAAVRFGTFSSVAAVLLDVSSFIIHRVEGHSANSLAPLSFMDFMTQHPAFLMVGVAALILLWLSGRK